MDLHAENDGQLIDHESTNLLAILEECQEMCELGIMHCLEEGGDFAETQHIRWLMDCKDICRIAISFFIRDSEYAGDVISICSFICEDCSESCKKLFDDKHMVNCSEVCSKCAQVCRNMISEEEISDEEE